MLPFYRMMKNVKFTVPLLVMAVRNPRAKFSVQIWQQKVYFNVNFCQNLFGIDIITYNEFKYRILFGHK